MFLLLAVVRCRKEVDMSVKRGTFSHVKRWLCVALLSGLVCTSSAFVLTGMPDGQEVNPTVGGVVLNNNLMSPGGVLFGMGGPKDLKKFFRWNTPYLVYSFDASFVNYFGFEGMDAVHDAFRVVNDFFVPEDGSYMGMSKLELAKHGFAGNYNTAWINTTAQNSQIIDIKSIVLGMLVNHLGIGNPHRHAFSMTGGTTTPGANQFNFQVRLRNYDPYTLKETDVINGVQYAYRLIHDGIPQAGGALPAITVVDMEEYTADTSGNAWTSVAGITDAFYGETMIYWTDQPTLFNFGVYYDGINSMGGQYQPRHALTFDDAGGLKYLYSTNTYAWESMDVSVRLIYPAQFLPTTQDEMRAINRNWSGVPAGLNFQNATGRRLPIWPRRGGANIVPSFRYTTPIFGQPVIGSTPGNAWQPGGVASVNNIGPADILLRGGVDKMQFYHQPFDSLLGVNFIPTNFVWTVPFVAQNGYNVGGLTNTTPGSSTWLGQQIFKFATMTVGRTVTEPDFIFVSDDLGTSVDGVPIAYNRSLGTNSWTETSAFNVGFFTGLNAPAGVGPGVINPLPVGAGTNITYTFTKLRDYFEMIWSGESTVVGNRDTFSIWGHIKGPGPNDLIVFPRDATAWRVENKVIPDASPPAITLISDNGGVGPIEQNTYTRSEETLTIIGSEMASVTAIEILSGDLVLQTIMPVDRYIQSNTQIDLPPGVFSEASEGAALELRVWNSIGVSQKGPQKFTIETGRPVIASTSADNIVYDRAETVTVRGYGFKSKTALQTKLAFLRVDDSQGSAVYDNGIAGSGTSDGLPLAATFEVINDTSAVLTINAIGPRADGSNRRLRVARSTVLSASDVDSVLSPPNNVLFAAITTKPVIASLSQLNASTTWEDVTTTGMFKRDRILEINGTALNTLTTIEIVQENGSSFANPVFIQLPNPAVVVDDNGTRIRVGTNAIPFPDSDNNSSLRRSFRLYNAAGVTDINGSLLFAVNVQPVVTGMGGFANPRFFNREKTIGDDVAIYGSGLMAVGEIHIIDSNGSDMNPSAIPKITLPHPGVTVADTQIYIDTQIAQFSEGATADTDINNTRRIFKLVGARDNATSPLADRFGVGMPPGIPAIAGFASPNNYNRHVDVMTITGTGYGMVTQVEIVDMFGNQIVGAFGVTPSTGVNVGSATFLTIDANASGWAGVISLLDHVTALGRRIRITTPFGTVTSSAITGGAFTVSGVAEFGTTVNDTFAGGGYNGGTTTYTQAGGNLFINGSNFRGVNRISFQGGGTVNVDIDPNNPPNGYWISANGTQIVIQSAVIPAGWIGGGARTVDLRSAAGVIRSTQAITTAP
jgi:hypothetical protein